MIDKIAGFNIGASDPVDNRLVLTKAEMKLRGTGPAYPMPDVYYAICKASSDTDEDPDIGKLFLYNKNNDDDETTGKFRSLDSEIKPTELQVQYHADDLNLELFGFNNKVTVTTLPPDAGDTTT